MVVNRFAIIMMVPILAHVILDMSFIAITGSALISMNVWMMKQIIATMISVIV